MVFSMKFHPIHKIVWNKDMDQVEEGILFEENAILMLLHVKIQTCKVFREVLLSNWTMSLAS